MVEKHLNEMVYRRQFFFGPEPAGIDGWNTAPMPGGYFVSSHPSLRVTQVVEMDSR